MISILKWVRSKLKISFCPVKIWSFRHNSSTRKTLMKLHPQNDTLRIYWSILFYVRTKDVMNYNPTFRKPSQCKRVVTWVTTLLHNENLISRWRRLSAKRVVTQDTTLLRWAYPWFHLQPQDKCWFLVVSFKTPRCSFLQDMYRYKIHQNMQKSDFCKKW